jgi:general secretion pathway protein G
MKRSAFTLVELLIVVIILGILAAVVIPQFSDASGDARFSSLQTNLATIRGQIELYKLQHNGTLPTLASFAAQMTGKTDVDGTPNASGKYGPYMQRIPNNPFSSPAANTVKVHTTSPALTEAWGYNATTGEFLALDGQSTNGVAHNTL